MPLTGLIAHGMRPDGARGSVAAVRYVTVVMVFALSAACSSGTDNDDAATHAMGSGELGDPSGYRCVVRPARALFSSSSTGAPRTPPWFTRGPTGLRLYARFGNNHELRWSDGARSLGTVLSSIGMHDGTLGWTGERYVSLRSEAAPQVLDHAQFAPWLPEDPNAWRSHEVVTYDAVYGDAKPLRTALPSNACGPSITEMAGRVLLLWFRRTRNGCDQGEASYQVLGRRGEALTPARVLVDGSRSLLVSAVSARWDFGRAVITASRTNSGIDPAWVLSASGEVLWHGFAGGVACSRAGCVRVRVDRESSVGASFGGNALRFERLDDEAYFSVSAQARDVRGVVASGDRVLVLHTPQSGSGCDVTVVDVAMRAVVGEHHEDSVSCDERRVRATPRGYLFAGVDTALGTVWRAIDCTR